MKGTKSIYRYSKVTQQKKFHLLTLVLRHKLLITQAASIVGINYSTAKTIMFFNRNHNKSYQFPLQKLPKTTQTHQRLQASYKQLTSISSQDPVHPRQSMKLVVVSSIGNQEPTCRPFIRPKRQSGKFTKRIRVLQVDYQEYAVDQKQQGHQHLQRPRTRSQSACWKSFLNSKSQQHQKRNIQSSCLPEIQEA